MLGTKAKHDDNKFAVLLALTWRLFWHVGIVKAACDTSSALQTLERICYANTVNITEVQSLTLNASTCFIELDPKVLRVYTPYSALVRTLQEAGKEYVTAGGYNLTVLSNPDPRDTDINVTRELERDILTYHDGFVVDAEALPEFAIAGVAAPLDTLVMREPGLNWFRIMRYYRGFAALHDQQTYGVPVGGFGMFLYYRTDVFQRLNISVPTTWEEVLATAKRWKGLDVNEDGTPDYSFCGGRWLWCGKNLLLTIAAPYLQARGTGDGFVIDPLTGSTLTGSAGFVRAMELYQQLAELGPPEDAQRCDAGVDRFANGTCLFTVDAFELFKTYAGPQSAVRDVFGMALPPGSSLVLNRTSGQLETCTTSLCPLATYVQQQQNEEQEAQQQEDDSSGRNLNLVNHAPYMLGGLVGIVNTRNPVETQGQVVAYFRTLSSLSMKNVLQAGSNIAPYRIDQYSDAVLDDWQGANYSAAALPAMQAAVAQLYASSNLAPSLRLPGQDEISGALYGAIAALTAGEPPASVAARLDAAVKGILAARYPTAGVNGTPGYLQLYRSQLQFQMPDSSSAPSPSLPPAQKPSSPVSRQTVVVISVVLGLAVLLAVVVAMEVRNKRHHKDLLGRVKPPLGDPDTTIVVAAIQDFDELWEALISDASERALQQFSELVDGLLRRHSGYRASSEDEEVVAAFHCPRDACEFALELQRGLLELRWPRHVLEMEQFRPQYLAQTKRASFSQSCTGQRAPALGGPPLPVEDDDKLFSLDTATDNVRSFGEQCAASWTPVEPHCPDAELAFCGIRARVGLCAVGFSRLGLEVEPGRRRYTFSGEAVEVATAVAAAAQGGMILIPQSTFRQLHLEVLAEQSLFCHLGEYQLTEELPPMDLYLALDRGLLGRLALFGPLSCHCQWSQGAFAAPVHAASMVFTHVVGVQTLLAWNYDLMQDVIETFTRLAQVELQQADGYLVEHVEGFMLTAFHSPAEAIMWGLRMQELMLKEDWPEELLAHELCEEVTVTVPVRGGEVTSATVFRGPRLKTGIDIGQVLARLHTMTGRMTYRGKVMNRAARISAAASSGQVLCSAEAWESCTATATAAMRLVTATSLGLFQLKGIQERIEVFHCTYQRHMPSSTRRSSTVSVGIASSSDNRRKSALALSSVSHISQLASHRTSQHTSAVVESSMSTSDGPQRRGSAASSPTVLPGVRSGTVMGGGQLADMLHMVGLDHATAGVLGGGGLVAAAAAAGGAGHSAAGRGNRQVLMPLLAGDGCSGGAPAAAAGGGPVGTSPLIALMPAVALTHTSHNSLRSHGSGGSGGGANAAARAALAVVLQSRTRSASAIHSGYGASSMRTRSARTRRHSPLVAVSGAASSEPQTSLAVGSPRLPAMQPAAAAAAGDLTAAPTTASPSGGGSEHPASPKAAAVLDLPRMSVSGVSWESFALGSGSTKLARDGAQRGGTGVAAASSGFASMPSAGLSSGPGSSHAASGIAVINDAPMAEALSGSNAPPVVPSGAYVHVPVVRAGVHAGEANEDHASQDVGSAANALIESLRDGVPFRDASGPGRAARASSPQRNGLGPQSPRDRDDLAGVLHTYQSDAGGPDDGAHVETLEVTVSVNGIDRRALSGGFSSNGFVGRLSSSNGRSFSRCASMASGLQFLAFGTLGAGVASGTNNGVGANAAGGDGGAAAANHSRGSSALSSGVGAALLPPGALGRPQSSGRSALSSSTSPPLGSCALAAATPGMPVVTSSGGGETQQSGSAGSLELFLPMPLRAGGKAAGVSRTGGSVVPRELNPPGNGAMASAGGNMHGGMRQPESSGSGRSSHGQRTLDGMMLPAARTMPAAVAMPRRSHGTPFGRRLAAVAGMGTAVTAAAVPGAKGSAPVVPGGGAGGASLRDNPDAPPPSNGSPDPFTEGAVASSSVTATRDVVVSRGDMLQHRGPVGRSHSAVVPDQERTAIGAVTAGRDQIVSSAEPRGLGDGDGEAGGGHEHGSAGCSAGGLRPHRTASGITRVASPASAWVSECSEGTSSLSTLPCAGSGSVGTAAIDGRSLLTPNRHLLRLATGSGGLTLLAAAAAVEASMPAAPDGNGSLFVEEDRPVHRTTRDYNMAPRVVRSVADAESQAAADVGARVISTGSRTDASSAGAAKIGGALGAGATPADYAAAAAPYGVGPPPPDLAAAAAAFGVDTAAADFAVAAAAFGVVPPPAGGASGGGACKHVSGPTPEQLQMAYTLLGESHHEGGGAWQ